MTVIGFVGRPRTGKTLHMTMMAYDYYRKGHKIFANYQLAFPFERMDVYDMIDIPFNDLERAPKTLCIQEADKIFDSWLRGSEQRMLSSLTGQSGKRNLNILYDTQFPSRVQKSLRDVTEYVITCTCFTDEKENPIAFEYTKIDLYDYSSKTYRIPVDLLKPFFSMYNSYETTQPIRSNKEKKERKELEQ
jgi:hypothetical protein